MYVGYSTNSNEYLMSVLDGSIVKSRSTARLVPSNRWHQASVMNIKGNPGNFNFGVDNPQVDEEVEAYPDPHANADDTERDARDTELQDTRPPPRRAFRDFEMDIAVPHMDILDREVKPVRKDFETYGFSDNCPKCQDLRDGVQRSGKKHTDLCRLRMYCRFL